MIIFLNFFVFNSQHSAAFKDRRLGHNLARNSVPASSVTRATLRMLLSLISWEESGAHAGGMRPIKIPLELICSRGWKPLKVRLDLKACSRSFIIEFLDVGEGSPTTSCLQGSKTQTKPY
jgi:hypothetical protein